MLGLLGACSSQVIATFGGVAGLNWQTVEMVASKRGIDTSTSWYGIAPWWDVFHMAEYAWTGVVNKKKPEEPPQE